MLRAVGVKNGVFSYILRTCLKKRQNVAAYEEAVSAGRGSISVDGKMIDVPVVLRAQELLAIYDAIQQREARRIE